VPPDPTRTDPASLGDGAAPDAAAAGSARPVEGDGPAEAGGRRHPWLRRAGVGAAALVGLLVLLAVGAAVYLQTEAGRARVQGIAVEQIANLLADDAEVSVDRLDGNFLTGAELVGLEVRRYGETVLAVDTVAIDYNLTTLLRRTFSASEVVVAGPALYVRQRADSTLNVSGLLAPRDTAGGGAGFAVVLDAVDVRRGYAEVRWLNAERDSVHTVRELGLSVREFVSREGELAGRIEALALEAVAPNDAGRLAVAGAGSFSNEALVLDALTARSRAGTDVEGEARLVFAGDETGGAVLPVFEANVRATPLALEDARAFAGVPLYGDPRLRLQADSDGGDLSFSLNAALDDGTLALDGLLSRAADGPVRYQAEGTLRRLDPSALTRNEALAAELTGDLRLNLRGESLETLTGPFAVTLRESEAAGRRIDRLAVEGAFTAGRVTFDVDGSLPGASLVAEGSAQPFDRVPQFRVAGAARDVDLAVLAPGLGRTERFSGEFAVVGRGSSLDTFAGSVAVDLDRADVDLGDRRLRLAGVALDADVADGAARFDLAAALAGGGGRASAAGTLDLGADPLAYTVTDGEVVALDLARVLPGREGSVTGTFTADGRGLDPQTADLDLTASLRDSRVGGLRLTAGEIAASLRRGTAEIDAALDFGPGGQLAAEGTARPFAAPPAYDLAGTMRNLDLAEITGNPDQYSDLTGTFSVEGSGVDPATADLAASLQITEPSSYGERFVDAADVTLSLAGGDLALAGTLATPEGEFTLDVAGRPFDEDGQIAVRNTCFSGLNLSRFADAAPRTRLNGCLDGTIAGFRDLGTAVGEGVVTLRPSTINGAEVEDGRAAFSLDAGGLRADLALDLLSPAADAGVPEGGALALTLTGRPFEDVPAFEVEGRTETLDVGALLDLPPDQPLRLSTRFSADVRGTDPETMTLTATVAGGRSVAGPVTVDTLRADVALAAGVLRVDTLVVDSDLADLAGGGTVALFDPDAGSAFALEGSVESLAPLAELTEQTVGVETAAFAVEARAEPGGPLRVVGTAEARQLVYGETAVTGLDAAVDGAWDRAAPDSLALFETLSGTASGSFAVLSTPSLRVREGSVTAALTDGEATVEGSVVADDRRDLDFFARLEPGVDPPTVLFERGRFAVDGTTWVLQQPARVTLADGVTVRGLLLATEAGGQQIAADGQIDFDGEQNFIVTVEDVAVGGLTDLVGLDGLGGALSATLVLGGPAAAPTIDGDVRLADFSSRGETVGALDLDLAYADGLLGLDAALVHVSGDSLTVRGSLPLQFSLAGGAGAAEGAAQAGVDLVARADGFPIAWAEPFVEARYGYTDLGGSLQLNLTVTGTQDDPRLGGRLRLRDGQIGVAATGMVYRPLLADVDFRDDQIVLDDVRVLEGGRRALDVTGRITLTDLSVGELDLTITPRGFVATDTRTYRGLTLDAGSVPLRLTGTLDAPVLRGAVVLTRGDVYLTDELVPPDLDPVELTDAQIRELEARFGRVVAERDTAESRFTDALDYDLTVEFRQNVWLRSEAGVPFDVEFEGDVQATKRSFAEESQLFGQIDLVRGTVETFNRQFDITRGTLTFNGPALGALVDLGAELDVRLPGTVAGQSSVTITLSVDGRFNEDLVVRLGSDPPLEQADIVSLIATGQFADDLNIAGGAGNLVLGRASGLIEGLASETLGVELVQIDYDGGDLVLKIGDYVTNRAFWTAGYVVPVGGQQQGEERLPIVFTLDYQLWQWLAAQTEVSGQRGVGGGAHFEFSR
jgi:translocation and assembly module TamB